MEKYLLIFNAGYVFTNETKKLGIRLQLMSLPEVLKYEKDAKGGLVGKLSWKYGGQFESDVKQLFSKFKARVIGIRPKDFEKAQAKGIQIAAPETEHFILNPWKPRNLEVEGFFPKPEAAK